jgi:hypothetical protein
MNPRSAASDTAKSELKVSPFEQITMVEEEQETRFQQTQESVAVEERETEKTLAASQKEQEDKLREEARAELREFANKDPAAILQKGKDETAAHLKDIDKNYDKNGSKIVQSLTEAVLDLSVL